MLTAIICNHEIYLSYEHNGARPVPLLCPDCERLITQENADRFALILMRTERAGYPPGFQLDKEYMEACKFSNLIESLSPKEQRKRLETDWNSYLLNALDVLDESISP